jgi:hypothetical protein
MALAAVLGLVAGFFAGNGLPYYVVASFGQRHRFLWGSSPLANLASGMGCFVIALVAWHFAHVPAHPLAGWAAVLVGLFLVALIHVRAWPNNSLRRPDQPAPEQFPGRLTSLSQVDVG